LTRRAHGSPCRAAILISGSGTNLQAFIDRWNRRELSLEPVLVISNRADAYGLTRATAAGIDTAVIDHCGYDSREAFDRRLAAELDAGGADLVILAGFMRILSPWFVRYYEGRVLNIHPALLPRYPGLDTHARALAAGDGVHGSTVHFVTDELDGGPTRSSNAFNPWSTASIPRPRNGSATAGSNTATAPPGSTTSASTNPSSSISTCRSDPRRDSTAGAPGAVLGMARRAVRACALVLSNSTRYARRFECAVVG
jgi:formyltetrahydrofolate-dependent phosphoribosylglycinamide formyltransferase